MESFDRLTLSETKALLRGWRENTERNGQQVLQIWESIIMPKLLKLENEKHIILEQVTVSSLDYFRIDVADKCLSELLNEFPDSIRVNRLNSMRKELTECYKMVLELLEGLIKKDDTNPAPRKRKIAVLMTRGTALDAITEICFYLSQFMSDTEAWIELCSTYLEEADYSKAIFCLEELILHNPHSYLHHIRLGDIRYTMGGIENMDLARSSYLCAIKLNPENVRALYGLFMVVVGKRKDAHTISNWVYTLLCEKFKKLSKKNGRRRYIERFHLSYIKFGL